MKVLADVNHLINVGSFFLYGCYDAVAFPTTWLTLTKNPKCARNTWKCILLNGFIFLGSLQLLPIGIDTILNSVSLIPSVETSPGVSPAFIDVFHYVMDSTITLFWLLPIYVICFLLNNFWYVEIADAAYQSQFKRMTRRESHRPKQAQEGIMTRIGATVADMTVSLTLSIALAIQIALMRFIPVFGDALGFLFTSWLYSLYCFEYTWTAQGTPLKQRLLFFERRWPYFLGFGFPFAALTYFFTPFLSGALFALLFPAFIVMSVTAVPRPFKLGKPDRVVPKKLPIFYVARLMTDNFVAWLAVPVFAALGSVLSYIFTRFVWPFFKLLRRLRRRHNATSNISSMERMTVSGWDTKEEEEEEEEEEGGGGGEGGVVVGEGEEGGEEGEGVPGEEDAGGVSVEARVRARMSALLRGGEQSETQTDDDEQRFHEAFDDDEQRFHEAVDDDDEQHFHEAFGEGSAVLNASDDGSDGRFIETSSEAEDE